MSRRIRTLSVDDQKAVDVLLDYGNNAREGRLTKHADAVSPRRLIATSKLLELLNALPAVEPPKDLVARTMERIDRDIAARAADLTGASPSVARAEIH